MTARFLANPRASQHSPMQGCRCSRAADQAGRHSAPEAQAFTAFRLPSLLPKPGLAQNSPSHPCGPLSACGGQLCSVLKQAALDASPAAMRNPVWLRGSAPPMGPRTYRPGPLSTAVTCDEFLTGEGRADEALQTHA